MIALVIAAAQLLAFGDGGVRLGATSLTTDAVDAAAYDPALELVWVVSAGRLEVLDLRDPTAAPVVIAKKMPEGAFAVAGASSAQFAVEDSPGPYPILRIAGNKGAIAVGAGVSGVPASEVKAAKKAIGKIKVVGSAWLAKLAARTVRTVDTPGESSLPPVELTPGMAACDQDPSPCGGARSLGGTRYELVVVADDCSDGCVDRCVLYDPDRKQFASPTQATDAWGAPLLTPDSCDGYAIEPGGDRFAVGTEVCTLGDEVTCAIDPAWSNVAWVDVNTVR